MHTKLNANAASIPSYLSGGQHGFFGITMDPAVYITITGHVFADPVYPGAYAHIPPQTSETIAWNIEWVHKAQLKQWWMFNQVKSLLKAQILAVFDGTYLKGLIDRYTGTANITVHKMIAYL